MATNNIQVLFDFDGTLADTLPYWSEVKIKSYHALGQDIDKDTLETLPFKPGIGRYIPGKFNDEVMFCEIKKQDTLENRLKAIRDGRISLMEDAKFCLEYLANKGCELYIISNAPIESGMASMHELGIYDYFKGILFSAKKPDISRTSDMVRPSKNDELWMIGDEIRDGQHAQNLGAKFILVGDTPDPGIIDKPKSSLRQVAYKVMRDSFEWLY